MTHEELVLLKAYLIKEGANKSIGLDGRKGEWGGGIYLSPSHAKTYFKLNYNIG